MTVPTNKDERIEGFHRQAQALVWEWMESSKVRTPIADTMDPLSCLTYAIVHQLEKTYQDAVEEPPKSKLSRILGR